MGFAHFSELGGIGADRILKTVRTYKHDHPSFRRDCTLGVASNKRSAFGKHFPEDPPHAIRRVVRLEIKGLTEPLGEVWHLIASAYR
jgi:hypothetical protein